MVSIDGRYFKVVVVSLNQGMTDAVFSSFTAENDMSLEMLGKNQSFSVELCGFQAGFDRPTHYDSRHQEGLHWKQFGLAREVRGRSWKCALRPHGKTTGPYRSLGGDRVGNLSTSSLSSLPLFWQPSTLAIPIPESF